jgi:hypothetical protein
MRFLNRLVLVIEWTGCWRSMCFTGFVGLEFLPLMITDVIYLRFDKALTMIYLMTRKRTMHY